MTGMVSGPKPDNDPGVRETVVHEGPEAVDPVNTNLTGVPGDATQDTDFDESDRISRE